ncbi:MAG: polysaccharide pyruvyl transferase CsaB [Clostridiales bacterium]|nr:polysaccharide pyruvyl transferase CsaB [Clostridiales bacterium]
MRIMHFAGGGDIGGAKTHILSLTRELMSGNTVCLVSFRKGPFAEEGRSLGIDVRDTDFGLNIVSALRMALAVVDEFKPDIIHCHGAKANMMGVLVKWRRRIPIVTTVHSDPKLDYLGSPLKQYTFGLINALALRRVDYYMAVAGRMDNNLIERGFDPQCIFTIYNGLDFSRASLDPRPAKPKGDIVVGIAARLTPIKDIPTLLRAFALAYEKNPRLRLKIAGTGEDGPSLRALALKLGIKERVDFVGWVTDMPGFYAQVDINVLASLSETFPYSLLEGAYEHCAAVASRVGGIPALIEHGRDGFLFEPRDVNALAEYIYQLSCDGELRQRLAENLFKRAKEEFSLQRMKEVQEAAYAVIKRSRGRQGRQGAVICGAYGRGNAGDEAILQAIISQMREIDSDMPLTVMSRNRKETRLNHHTNAIYIFNIFGFLRNLRRSRIFINGGGSLIQDVTSSRSLYFYLFTLQAAKWCGCRVIMYGCGIGPVLSAANRRVAGRILDRTAEVITLRDNISRAALREMRVEKPRILLAADPTINIQRSPADKVQRAFVLENVPPECKKIGFCLRSWPNFNAAQPLAAAAGYAYKKYGLTPVFVPIELPRDIAAAEPVLPYMTVPYHVCRKRHRVEDLIGMLGSMEVVVGMRLHALVFATLGGAPVVGVSYDVKVDSFIQEIGSHTGLSLDMARAEELYAGIDRALAFGKAGAEAAAGRLREAERVNIEAATELLAISNG